MGQWNPLHDLLSLQDRMNRLFEDATQRRAVDADPRDEIEKADWIPLADVYENDIAYVIAVDLPGIDRSTLDVSVDDHRLTIKGTRPEVERNNRRDECPRGRFLRTFSLPTSVDQSAIRADYKDGVLEVQLPKRAERKPQRVEIKVS